MSGFYPPPLGPIEDDVERVIAAIRARHPELDATATGSMVNTISGVIALARRDAMRWATMEVAKTFVQFARGEDLTRLAQDHLSLARHEASQAAGTLRITRTSAPATVALAVGTVFTDERGGTYETTEAVSMSGTEQEVDVRALQAGPEGNRPAGLSWWPSESGWLANAPGLQVRNAEPIAGGNRAETDEEFRVRIAEFWRALRRATPNALRFVALSIPEVRRATVNEDHIRPERGGYVELFVTDATDGFNAALGRMVRARIDADGRAAGVVVNVRGARVIPVTVRVRLAQRAGSSAAAIGRALDAIKAYVSSIAIGAPLERARVIAAAMAADSAIVSCEVLEPLVDQYPAGNEVIRVRDGEVTLG